MSTARRMNDLLERLTGRRLVKRQADAQRFRSAASRQQVSELRRLITYQALNQLHLRRSTTSPDDEVDLRTAELKVFSQNGEDGIIDALVRDLPVESRYFVEFGVQDGSECNTRLLAEVFGWSGLYIEPAIPEFDALARRHVSTSGVSCLNEAVTPENVNTLFGTAGVPKRFGVLSIDVDGQDFWIWEALSTEYEPAVVVIECNTGFPTGSLTVEAKGFPWDEDFGGVFGASTAALVRLGHRKGYELVHVDLAGVNAFFVRKASVDDAVRTLIGLTNRSPNYSLTGTGHPSSPRRPTVEIGASIHDS